MSSKLNGWKYLATKNGEKVKIDAEDFERVSERSWRVIYTGKAQKPSVVTSIRTGTQVRTMTLGQFLMNPPKGQLVYPRRWQQGLDYRKQNLIVCSMKERQRMLPKRADKSSSRYKGVSFVKSKKLWRARIEKNGRSHYLGDFSSEEHAALAYNKAARDLFGDQAYQNQIIKSSERRN
jgi:AP2-like factor, euAP2 lineage